ncbi:hypothetical protein GLOTRDRAFT_35895 [Gloeophyllum trabeum ATCC 11539]|uniref:DUF6534 domain-containing protein n=1 Tax=Gloeophyllum trabeum (strain ATCC 11539 / FP-39264 / Madison 617) TaxID=670483 RepID=S7RYV8_GLOTA|nr:uncharacterized protein GLOTRDRAFT_35895 [Gloeophyllum trabeum ATCC 11539]EPQ58599.1 hypothetical protein GLOTRDRAFT_35895 [Gloeophyllum trabeum ATCC 11539]
MSNATATPDAALLAAFDPNATLGALQVGCLLSTFLFGIVTVQTFMYYQTAPNDRSVLKILVREIPSQWLELGHTICVCHTLYITTITDYGHPERLVKTPISLSVSILFSGIVGPLVQSFFAYRMWVIAGSPYLPICCWSLSGLRFIGSVIAAAEAFRMKSLSQYESQWQWLLTAILAVGAANDVIIASSLSYALNRQRNTVMRETVALVDKLVLYTIRKSVYTLCVANWMSCNLLIPSSVVWLAIFMFLAKCETHFSLD